MDEAKASRVGFEITRTGELILTFDSVDGEESARFSADTVRTEDGERLIDRLDLLALAFDEFPRSHPKREEIAEEFIGLYSRFSQLETRSRVSSSYDDELRAGLAEKGRSIP